MASSSGSRSTEPVQSSGGSISRARRFLRAFHLRDPSLRRCRRSTAVRWCRRLIEATTSKESSLNAVPSCRWWFHRIPRRMLLCCARLSLSQLHVAPIVCQKQTDFLRKAQAGTGPQVLHRLFVVVGPSRDPGVPGSPRAPAPLQAKGAVKSVLWHGHSAAVRVVRRRPGAWLSITRSGYSAACCVLIALEMYSR